MNIVMSYIDHHLANIEDREKFSFGKEDLKRLYDGILEGEGVLGAVLLNTCNRTEIYISAEEGKTPDPIELFCKAADLPLEKARAISRTLAGDDAFRHICRLTAGAESQLWGDTQIITQVVDATEEAREIGASDAALNTAFRIGITCGKAIRTNVDLHIHDDSTADLAVNRITGEPDIEKVLVIGNGNIGRLIAAGLVRAGKDTTVTIRRYRHGDLMIPAGVKTIQYDERYRAMEDVDAVVSATASPHFVLTAEKMEGVESMPGLLIDMAVPRDIDPAIEDMAGVDCYNIDTIGTGQTDHLKEEQVAELEGYIDSYLEELHRWERHRNRRLKVAKDIIETEEKTDTQKYFPVFIDSTGRKVIVIGGGMIAERRILTLTSFDFEITVVSEDLTDTLKRLVDAGVIEWIRDKYDSRYLEGAEIALACTNNRAVNKEIGQACRERNIAVSVCDARKESTFWFPAIALNDELVMGLVGNGKRHDIVKKAAATLRRVIRERSYRS